MKVFQGGESRVKVKTPKNGSDRLELVLDVDWEKPNHPEERDHIENDGNTRDANFDHDDRDESSCHSFHSGHSESTAETDNTSFNRRQGLLPSWSIASDISAEDYRLEEPDYHLDDYHQRLYRCEPELIEHGGEKNIQTSSGSMVCSDSGKGEENLTQYSQLYEGRSRRDLELENTAEVDSDESFQFEDLDVDPTEDRNESENFGGIDRRDKYEQVSQTNSFTYENNHKTANSSVNNATVNHGVPEEVSQEADGHSCDESADEFDGLSCDLEAMDFGGNQSVNEENDHLDEENCNPSYGTSESSDASSVSSVGWKVETNYHQKLVENSSDTLPAKKTVRFNTPTSPLSSHRSALQHTHLKGKTQIIPLSFAKEESNRNTSEENYNVSTNPTQTPLTSTEVVGEKHRPNKSTTTFSSTNHSRPHGGNPEHIDSKRIQLKHDVYMGEGITENVEIGKPSESSQLRHAVTEISDMSSQKSMLRPTETREHSFSVTSDVSAEEMQSTSSSIGSSKAVEDVHSSTASMFSDPIEDKIACARSRDSDTTDTEQNNPKPDQNHHRVAPAKDTQTSSAISQTSEQSITAQDGTADNSKQRWRRSLFRNRVKKYQSESKVSAVPKTTPARMIFFRRRTNTLKNSDRNPLETAIAAWESPKKKIPENDTKELVSDTTKIKSRDDRRNSKKSVAGQSVPFSDKTKLTGSQTADSQMMAIKPDYRPWRRAATDPHRSRIGLTEISTTGPRSSENFCTKSSGVIENEISNTTQEVQSDFELADNTLQSSNGVSLFNDAPSTRLNDVDNIGLKSGNNPWMSSTGKIRNEGFRISESVAEKSQLTSKPARNTFQSSNGVSPRTDNFFTQANNGCSHNRNSFIADKPSMYDDEPSKNTDSRPSAAGEKRNKSSDGSFDLKDSGMPLIKWWTWTQPSESSRQHGNGEETDCQYCALMCMFPSLSSPLK